MSLSARCKNSFRQQDIDRGDQYFRSDRASVLGANELRVDCAVDGKGSTYAVEFDLEPITEGAVDAYCECPRFADGFFCKHVWAALRELDSMVDVPGNAKLKLRFAVDPTLDDLSSQLRTRLDQPAKADKPAKRPNKKAKSDQGWRKQFKTVKRALDQDSESQKSPLEEISAGSKQMWYVLQHSDRARAESMVLRTFESSRKLAGGWSIPQRKGISGYDIDRYGNAEDGEILRQLKPATPPGQHDRFGTFYHSDGFVIPAALIPKLLPRIVETGRLAWTTEEDSFLRQMQPLNWDSNVWKLRIRLSLEKKSREVEIVPELYHSDEVRPVNLVVSAFSDGIIQFVETLSLTTANDARWIDALQRDEMQPVPVKEVSDLLTLLTSLPHLPELEIDKRLKIQRNTSKPIGKVVIRQSASESDRRLFVDPMFKYGEHEVGVSDQRTEIWQAEDQQLLCRDLDAETELIVALKQLPFEHVRDPYTSEVQLCIPAGQFVDLVHTLSEAGWEVIAHGRPVRQVSNFDIQVSGDNDWFDLQADANFDGISASLPSLLAALKQRSQFVTLDDGSKGILPEEWLEKYARLAEIASEENEDSLRFSKSQALLLDAMLADQEGVRVDRNFTKICKKLKAFDGIAPGKEPRGFQGELRDYQRDGVGWFGFLREFGFGGCLADDMGLGKTVQVLAMLQSRKTRRLKKDEQRRPSIVVVPKSLVFNWIDEAAKFAPKLRVRNYTGSDRAASLELLDKSDLYVTTYGTLRRDIETLKDVEFDYVILDESQAVKNAKSLAAKAVRLIQANHRLAMTGTPVENHVGELWALFDFLNPGMLGTGAAFKRASRATGDAESLEWLSNAIRPFILRRTKQQVLTELPDKIEQTLVCDMTSKQKKKYGELRDYYRVHLSNAVEEKGIKRSKIHVLEALLRLRQAACDPRLLGEKEAPGAKIELLVEQLEGLLGDGHKALVFSQFTSLLALVRKEFDDRGWTYEYLDGKTRNRAAKVARFQEDDACPLFLISLKAGGSGLNLTAADYVFILDPWWNPAVEAQAVDRAHRIGQTKSVMAYRILCKDTVEDKIIKLQQSKRDLADAIITADKSLISELSMDDLQMLLE